MLDFLLVSTKCPKNGVIEIFPKFILGRKSDLMIRGGDFYAVWNTKYNALEYSPQVVILQL